MNSTETAKTNTMRTTSNKNEKPRKNLLKLITSNNRGKPARIYSKPHINDWLLRIPSSKNKTLLFSTSKRPAKISFSKKSHENQLKLFKIFMNNKNKSKILTSSSRKNMNFKFTNRIHNIHYSKNKSKLEPNLDKSISNNQTKTHDIVACKSDSIDKNDNKENNK